MKKLVDENLARLITTAKDIDLDWQVDKKDMLKYFAHPEDKHINFLVSLINSKN